MTERRSMDALTAPHIGNFASLHGPTSGWPLDESPEYAEKQTRIDWSGYWRSIVKRRWPILAVACIATVVAAFFTHSIQPVFRSTTTLLIESGKTKILSIEEVYNGVSQDREYYQTQVEILRSRDVALRTVATMKLWEEPEFDPRKPTRGWITRAKELVFPPYEPPEWTPELLAEATVGKFLGALSIEPVRLSQLVKISFDAHDRKLAARMADATANSFIEADREARLKLNLSVNGQLQDRLSALRDRLLQSEQDLQKYRESSGLVSISGSPGIAGQQMSEISQRLVFARVRRTELESAYQQVERNSGNNYAGVAAVINQPELGEARNRVALATLKLEELARTRGDENTRVIEARGTLATAQQQLETATRSVVQSLKGELQAARANEQALQNALESARSAVQGVNRQEFQLGVLEREVQTNKQLYELLLSRTKETSVSSNLQSAVARIVDAASPGGAPIRPNKPQIVLVALTLALAAGAAIAILLDKFNRTVQGSSEAENRLRHPVLTALPKFSDTPGEGMPRLFLDEPKSQHADGIRTARTSMLLAGMVVAHKTVLVTSALAGEGRTTFCTNLAFAYAVSRRTLLIDCDLRNPQIGTLLGLPRDAPGIVDFAEGLCDMKDCVHAIRGSPLLVVPAGNLSVDPEDFVMSVAFQNALRLLSNRVDVVLIDSPPVTTSADALILSQQVNDTIYVVKANETPHLVAQRGLEQLRRAGASIFGLVLTNTDEVPVRAQPRTAGGTVFVDKATIDEQQVLGV